MSGRYDLDPGQTKGHKGFLNQFTELEDIVTGHKKTLRTSHKSVEEGELRIRNGNFYIMGDDDDIDISMIPGAIPTMTMYAKGLANETHSVIYYSTDFSSAPELTDQAGSIYISRISDNAVDGGRFILARSLAFLGWGPQSGSPYGTGDQFIWIARQATSITDRVISFQGKWANYGQYSNSDALEMGTVNVGAGGTGTTVSYAATYISTVVPVVTLLNSGGAISWCLTAQTTSGFTIAWSGTAAKTINFWIFRV